MNRMEEDDYEQQQNLSDDDNAAAAEEEADGAASEDPLLLALDDLEGRLVSGLDQFRLHTGRRSGEKDSIHDELGTLLQQVLEVAAHTGPSVARTYFRGSTSDGLDEAVESAYERLVSDLVLPVLLEVAQSDTIAAKRAATLQFFRNFYKESLKAGSWADQTTLSGAAGPYGAGGSSSAAPLPRAVITRRAEKRLARLGEILRYWMQAAIACLTPGVFTAADAAAATASRGILAASAALRPALKHIVQRIKNADDRGASRLYSPVMKMVEGVLQQIWFTQQQEDPPAENLLAAAIKFLETVLLCCSHKAPELASSSSRRGKHAAVRSVVEVEQSCSN
jgi:symplekin